MPISSFLSLLIIVLSITLFSILSTKKQPTQSAVFSIINYFFICSTSWSINLISITLLAMIVLSLDCGNIP